MRPQRDNLDAHIIASHTLQFGEKQPEADAAAAQANGLRPSTHSNGSLPLNAVQN